MNANYDVIEASDLMENKCPKCGGKLVVTYKEYTHNIDHELVYTDVVCENRYCRNIYRILND